MVFKNRQAAGLALAKVLIAYRGRLDVVILGLARGGVVVAFEIARSLDLPLDVFVCRKIGFPGNSEYAIGAVSENGETVFNEGERSRIDQSWLKSEIRKETEEATRRVKVYRGGRTLHADGKTVVLVDDGVATGYTLRAAVKGLRRLRPKEIIVAVPHGAPDALAQLRAETDTVVALAEPEWYGAVGAFYEEFPQNTDEEIVGLLEETRHSS